MATTEQTAHLGYEKGDPGGCGTPNSRNGSSPKTLHTEAGEVALDVPRDRAGTFEPAPGAEGLAPNPAAHIGHGHGGRLVNGG